MINKNYLKQNLLATIHNKTFKFINNAFYVCLANKNGKECVNFSIYLMIASLYKFKFNNIG